MPLRLSGQLRVDPVALHADRAVEGHLCRVDLTVHPDRYLLVVPPDSYAQLLDWSRAVRGLFQRVELLRLTAMYGFPPSIAVVVDLGEHLTVVQHRRCA